MAQGVLAPLSVYAPRSVLQELFPASPPPRRTLPRCRTAARAPTAGPAPQRAHRARGAHALRAPPTAAAAATAYDVSPLDSVPSWGRSRRTNRLPPHSGQRGNAAGSTVTAAVGRSA